MRRVRAATCLIRDGATLGALIAADAESSFWPGSARAARVRRPSQATTCSPDRNNALLHIEYTLSRLGRSPSPEDQRVRRFGRGAPAIGHHLCM